MLSVKEIINQVSSLPIEDRIAVVDSLLETINHPQKEIDDLWTQEAEKRLEQMRSGEVAGIPGDEVFGEIQARFAK